MGLGHPLIAVNAAPVRWPFLFPGAGDLMQELGLTTAAAAKPPDAKGWADIIGKVGVPSILALGFAWHLVQQSREDMRALAADTRQQLEMHARETRDLSRQHGALLLRICVNTAKTSDERDRCLGVQP